MTVDIRLGEAPLQSRPEVVAAAAPAREEARMDEKLGVRIENMNRASAEEYGYDDVDGVVITDVQVNGPAARRGLTPGWKILEINRQRVRNRSDVDRIMGEVDSGDIVTLRVAEPRGSQQIVHVRVSR